MAASAAARRAKVSSRLMVRGNGFVVLALAGRSLSQAPLYGLDAEAGLFRAIAA